MALILMIQFVLLIVMVMGQPRNDEILQLRGKRQCDCEMCDCAACTCDMTCTCDGAADCTCGGATNANGNNGGNKPGGQKPGNNGTNNNNNGIGPNPGIGSGIIPSTAKPNKTSPIGSGVIYNGAEPLQLTPVGTTKPNNKPPTEGEPPTSNHNNADFWNYAWQQFINHRN